MYINKHGEVGSYKDENLFRLGQKPGIRLDKTIHVVTLLENMYGQ